MSCLLKKTLFTMMLLLMSFVIQTSKRTQEFTPAQLKRNLREDVITIVSKSRQPLSAEEIDERITIFTALAKEDPLLREQITTLADTIESLTLLQQLEFRNNDSAVTRALVDIAVFDGVFAHTATSSQQ